MYELFPVEKSKADANYRNGLSEIQHFLGEETTADLHIILEEQCFLLEIAGSDGLVRLVVKAVAGSKIEYGIVYFLL